MKYIPFTDDIMFHDVLINNPELTGHLLDDECVRIVLNSKGTIGEVSEKLQAFIDYLNQQEVSSVFTERLQEEVDDRNRDYEWKGGYMTLERRSGKGNISSSNKDGCILRSIMYPRDI